MTKTLEPTSQLSKIDGEIREKKTKLAEFDRETKKTRRSMVGEIARLQRRRKTIRVATPKRQITAAKQAGKKNIAAVREAITKAGGTATQAKLGELSGVGTGSLTWAIRALEETGEIRATGKRERGSREFTLRKKSRTLKPGEGE